MTWPEYFDNVILSPPFCTTDRLPVNLNCAYDRHHPYNQRQRRRQLSYRHDLPEEKSPSALKDRSTVDRNGDLGWTLDYATAWAFRNLISNQTEVVDALNRVREVSQVTPQTPFVIFDYLSRVLFGGKLRGMVYMRWKSLASFSPGITSAAGIVPGVSRICIELNNAPFVDDDAGIDMLLDELIHQMIHAYFLVAVGAQPTNTRQDGRLMDGLHFGVLLLTIKDLSRECQDGPLDLMFYAATRRRRMGSRPSGCQGHHAQQFIAFDPRSSSANEPPNDGQSHCTADNRRVRFAQLKNWQVETYASALDLGLEGKGYTLYDLSAENELVEVNRLHAPPSNTYVELIWEGHRVMVKRENAIKYKSIKKPLKKNEKMELAIPECSQFAFRHIYDFFNKGAYAAGAELLLDAGTLKNRRGPPVLIRRRSQQAEPQHGVAVQLEIFNIASAMDFEELQQYVLGVIWNMPITDDDPIEILRQLYSDDGNKGPQHAEMHKWAREFLARTEGSVSREDADDMVWSMGMSNYEKIRDWHGDRFQALYYRNAALKDDCKSVARSLNHRLEQPRLAIVPPLPPPLTVAEVERARMRLARIGSPMLSSDNLPIYSPYSYPSSSLGVGWPPISLVLSSDDSYSYSHIGRDCRFKVRDPPIRRTLVRRPRSLYDLSTSPF